MARAFDFSRRHPSDVILRGAASVGLTEGWASPRAGAYFIGSMAWESRGVAALWEVLSSFFMPR
jgi:hypothetical protein